MAAPFRITKPSPSGTMKTAGGISRAQGDIGSWMERLVKLVPSEVIGIYLTGRGYAESWIGSWSIVCLVLVFVSRIFGTREPDKGVQWIAVFVSAVSFIIWLYAIGGKILEFKLPDPGIAYIAVLVWTFIVPYFYKGE